ncbi:hypothetical protein L1987_78656 [Smallanthus sonchifolius]|uniref:Uncharacterized protein n=1 Tax=Smallanthus sonchifolius TaxID=185202 RepID=A0ACB8ZCZ2_9ASTR|nr:hypothetical protein L1987_78656 [Smallanthus sonchifolius]
MATGERTFPNQGNSGYRGNYAPNSRGRGFGLYRGRGRNHRGRGRGQVPPYPSNWSHGQPSNWSNGGWSNGWNPPPSNYPAYPPSQSTQNWPGNPRNQHNPIHPPNQFPHAPAHSAQFAGNQVQAPFQPSAPTQPYEQSPAQGLVILISISAKRFSPPSAGNLVFLKLSTSQGIVYLLVLD